MNSEALTLHSNIYANGVEAHNDLLDKRPCVLSRERAKKVSPMTQDPMPKKGGFEKCRLCHPETLVGNPVIRPLAGNKVGAFPNSAPLLAS